MLSIDTDPFDFSAQFWWVLGLMVVVAAGLLIAFRLKRWI